MKISVKQIRLSLIVLCMGFTTSCNSSQKLQDAGTPSPSTAKKGVVRDIQKTDVFDPNRVLSIDVTMAEDDWDTLRKTGRDFSTTYTECPGVRKKIYSYHRAKVTIDGVTLESVGVRKKGYMGSLSVLRPSL